MRRMIRIALPALTAALLAVGCGKDEGKPNENLKAPDVPPGRGAEGGGSKEPPKGKK